MLNRLAVYAAASLLVAAAVLHPLQKAFAGGTDPLLSIVSANAIAGTSTVTLAVNGAYQRGDVIQIDYPVQLLLWDQGASTYLRFDLTGTAYSGQNSGLADGLNASEAAALLNAGTVTANARILRLDPDRIEVAVPSSFPSGSAQAQLFVDEGGVVLSNAITVNIPSPGAP